jgi:predicted transcriptional regulator
MIADESYTGSVDDFITICYKFIPTPCTWERSDDGLVILCSKSMVCERILEENDKLTQFFREPVKNLEQFKEFAKELPVDKTIVYRSFNDLPKKNFVLNVDCAMKGATSGQVYFALEVARITDPACTSEKVTILSKKVRYVRAFNSTTGKWLEDSVFSHMNVNLTPEVIYHTIRFCGKNSSNVEIVGDFWCMADAKSAETKAKFHSVARSQFSNVFCAREITIKYQKDYFDVSYPPSGFQISIPRIPKYQMTKFEMNLEDFLSKLVPVVRQNHKTHTLNSFSSNNLSCAVDNVTAILQSAGKCGGRILTSDFAEISDGTRGYKVQRIKISLANIYGQLLIYGRVAFMATNLDVCVSYQRLREIEKFTGGVTHMYDWLQSRENEIVERQVLEMLESLIVQPVSTGCLQVDFKLLKKEKYPWGAYLVALQINELSDPSMTTIVVSSVRPSIDVGIHKIIRSEGAKHAIENECYVNRSIIMFSSEKLGSTYLNLTLKAQDNNGRELSATFISSDPKNSRDEEFFRAKANEAFSIQYGLQSSSSNCISKHGMSGKFCQG